jgi:hypothetical protein
MQALTALDPVRVTELAHAVVEEVHANGNVVRN